MKAFTLVPLLSLPLMPCGWAQAPVNSSAAEWEKSIVRVEISRKTYDYYQPWSRQTDRTVKAGLVVGEQQVLTTALDMTDHTLVRLQKGGRGEWTQGTVTWVDYHANLALLTAAEDTFWRGLSPARFANTVPRSETPLQIVRWREGKLETRRAEFTQFAVRQSEFSALNLVQLELDSEIQAAGWGEPVVANSHVVGILTRQNNRGARALPASFVRAILEARRAGEYRGLGYFHFYWQPAQNIAALEYLGLTGAPRGVLVIKVPGRLDGEANVLQPRDIILQIDGFNIDIEGDYVDPDYGPLMLENLALRGKWAGDEVKLRVWRDGREQALTYRLPKYEYAHSVVPMEVCDQPPEYLILGGLVFQPLTRPYLERWGSEWEQRAPFRLRYFAPEEATRSKPSVVILSQVLPDEYNIGYQDQRYLVLEKLNGRSVNTLAELRTAVQNPTNGFHVLDFLPNESFQRMVLGANGPDREATLRVLERYSIEEPFFIASEQ